MKDEEFRALHTLVNRLHASGRLSAPDSYSGAIFVAFCAEWFRRESSSTFLRWNDPAPNILSQIPDEQKRELTEIGLRMWGRPLRVINDRRRFLLSIALEGGFPVRLLREGARGWLKDYLRAVMRRAIAFRVDEQEEILSIAQEERGRMRQSYQHDDFIALCSELIATLIQLRTEAEANQHLAIRNSSLLDSIHPGWRDTLPIYVPPADEALADELLSGLLNERMTGLNTEGVEICRYLIRRNDVWNSAIQLLADGEVPSAKLPHLPHAKRYRAVATGALSDHIAAELALFEPPPANHPRWRVRPYARTVKLLTGFRFDDTVTVALSSSEGMSYPWVWPRGDAIRSDILIFEVDGTSTPDQEILRLVGTGSYSGRSPTLYVLVPSDWQISPKSPDGVSRIEALPALGRQLALISGAAYFKSPEIDATPFLVEPSSEESPRELELRSTEHTSLISSNRDIDIYTSPITPWLKEGSNPPRLAKTGEMFVRQRGGPWAPLLGELSGSGSFELSWRDPLANIQIEKHTIGLLPRGSSISGSMKSGNSAHIILSGLDGWQAAVALSECQVEYINSNQLVLSFTGRPYFKIPLTLRPPHGQSVGILLTMTGRDPAVVASDGAIVKPGSRIDSSNLRGAIAYSPSIADIHVTPATSRSAGVKLHIDGELPLGTLLGPIGSIFASTRDQDELVHLNFVGSSQPSIRISQYRFEQLTFSDNTVCWPRPPGTNTRPVAKMILNPADEYDLVTSDDTMWRTPESFHGPCLLYLRNGIDVLSRPAVIGLPLSESTPLTGIQKALSLIDHVEREDAIRERLSAVREGHLETDTFEWMRTAILHLDGLSCKTFDALSILPEYPEVLVRILLNSRSSEERAVIWSLQNELSFLWLGLPLDAWKSGMFSDLSNLAAALTPVLGEEKAKREAVAWLRSICAELIALEPAFAELFSGAGLSAPFAGPSLRDLIRNYVRDAHDRDEEQKNQIGLYVAALRLPLPNELQEVSHEHFSGLFAPLLLSLSACGLLTLDTDTTFLVRKTLLENPLYVSSAWVPLIRFYGAHPR
jgi:hypothetical protein